jgi:Protein of unknown function (DUF2695)
MIDNYSSNDVQMAEGLDDESIEVITPYVLEALRNKNFFERLDDQLSPVDVSVSAKTCTHTYDISTTTLAECGFDAAEIEDIKQEMLKNGGCCDCEILYNVAEDSRLKSRYWKKRFIEKTSESQQSHQEKPVQN